MKKQFYFLLGILVTFSLIISCDKSEPDLEPTICKITVTHDGNGAVSITNYIGTLANVLIGNQVEVVATPAVGYAFIGWYMGDSNTPVSAENRFVFTASENTTLIAKFSKLTNLVICSAGYGSVSFKGSADNVLALLPGNEVTVIATPDKGCDFIGWFVGDAESPVSTDAEYTFIVTEDITLIARFKLPIAEAIDLGLSVKWAPFNVGAALPEGYGDYYAWGETEKKKDYSLETYKWCSGGENIATKYCTNSDYGTVDNKTVLDPEDDVAHVKWGGSWRIPTENEHEELRSRCTWTWTTRNGVNGYEVTGPNGNSIFLPAAGKCTDMKSVNEGDYGYYWSSSSNDEYPNCALELGFGEGMSILYITARYLGNPVRPVCD